MWGVMSGYVWNWCKLERVSLKGRGMAEFEVMLWTLRDPDRG